jgi:hypothetical protein
MIAKATPKGKSFKGIINYLFKGRLEGRGTIQKNPTVITSSNNLELPVSEDDVEGINRLIDDFVNQSKFHADYQSNTKLFVGHHIISFSKEDMLILNEVQIKEIIQQYVLDAGLKDTQYIAVSHEDTDDFHVHLVFNRCLNNLKIYDDWKEKIKASEKAVALNLKYDLPLVGRQKDMLKLSGVWEFRIQHEDIQELSQDPLLKDIRNLHHFKKASEAANRKIVEDEKTIEVDGKKYRKSDLEAVFFKNRRDRAKGKGFTAKKTHYKTTKDKTVKPTPEHKLKQLKYLKQQRNLEENLIKQVKERENTSHNLPSAVDTDNRQNFNYKKAWQSDKDDEFLSKKKKKKF